MRVLWCAPLGVDIGVGHVMRGVPLAERCRVEGIQCDLHVLGGEISGLDVTAFSAVSERVALDDIDEGPGAVVVLDAYGLEPDDYRRAGASGAVVVALDDHGVGHFPVDVLVDIDATVTRAQRTRPDTVRLSGPDHALVRSEFLRHRRVRPLRPPADRQIVVSFGGSDPNDLGPLVAGRLADLAGEVLLVRGPRARRLAAPDRVQVIDAPPSFAALLDGADLVVGAAGTTALEVAAMGQVGVVVPVAANQTALGDTLAASGAARVVSDPSHVPDAVSELLDRVTHHQVASRALALVDGHGPARLLDALRATVAERPEPDR